MASIGHSENSSFDNNFDVSGSCNVCKTLCSNRCSRCDQHYCSLKCQREDWMQHRYNCFKMPYLIMGPPISSTNSHRGHPSINSHQEHPSTNYHQGHPSNNSHQGYTSNNSHQGHPSNNSGPSERFPNVRSSNNTERLPNVRSTNNTERLYNENQNGLHTPNSKFINDKRSLEKNVSPKSSSSSLSNQNNSEVKTIRYTDEPKNNEDVTLTWVNKTNAFYIRACRYKEEYIKDCRYFDQYGQNGKKLFQIPERNKLVLVKWEGKFVRGIVLNSSNKEKIRVAFVDIGGTSYKRLEEFREIGDELLERKRSNFKIILDDIGNGVDDQEFEKLLNFVHAETVFKLQFEGDTYSSGKKFKLFEKRSQSALVELLRGPSSSNRVKLAENSKASEPKKPFNTKEPFASTQSVEPQQLRKEERQKCIETSEVIPNPKLATSAKTFINDLTSELLLEGAIDIVILDTSMVSMGCISLIALEHVGRLDKLHTKIQETAADSLVENYEPENKEICLVKFEEEWYRAEYVADCDQFSFIDYGNYSPVERSDVKILPLSLRDNCFTNMCYIENFTRPSLKETEELTEFLLQNNTQKGCNIRRELEDDEPVVYVTLQVIADFFKR